MAVSGSVLFGCGGIALIIIGCLITGSGLTYAKQFYQEANKLSAKIMMWQQLNSITSSAHAHYEKHEYKQFLEQLARFYTDNRSTVARQHQLLNLADLNGSFNAAELITPLLEHGFRPDMVAI